MSQRRLSVRKIKEVLRLFHEKGCSKSEIARSCNIGATTVSRYLDRAKEAGISYPVPDNLSDELLGDLLFPKVEKKIKNRPLPDWPLIQKELSKKGVTLELLWMEYRESYPDGYGLSRFYALHKEWESTVDPVMRQSYKAGEKLFVDYAGPTLPMIDRETGEIRDVQIFVAVLGASSYTYVEGSESQKVKDWVQSHINAFHFFEGVPEVVVPDNLKSGVKSPCYYDPDINPTYQDLARHYGIAVLPTRVRKPKDKAKAESGVLQVERWILARLRNQQFFSVQEINEAIAPLLEDLNSKTMEKSSESRKSLYESIDRPALRSLPDKEYILAAWGKKRVGADYHVEVDDHYYSVPYKFIRKECESRITDNTVEIYIKSKRVASHQRSFKKGEATTLRDHMPKNHREYSEWSSEKFISRAEKIGTSVYSIIKQILESQKHQEQGFRMSLGVLSLGRSYGDERLEAACKRALQVRAYSYKSIRSILEKGLDQVEFNVCEREESVTLHSNIRGSEYYH